LIEDLYADLRRIDKEHGMLNGGAGLEKVEGKNGIRSEDARREFF